MNINFTKKEYRSLIELLYMADWLVNAHTADESEHPQHYAELIQKVYSHAKEMDCDDYITYEKTVDGYCETLMMDEESPCREYIERFEAQTFWEELINRLSERDAIKALGESVFAEDVDRRFKAGGEAEQRWGTECEEHGIDRLQVRALSSVK